MSILQGNRIEPDASPFRRAVIVDDHPLFCDALSMTLKAVVGIAEIESYDQLETALDRLERGRLPDVVVLDLNLPDVSGLDGLVRVRTTVASVPIVVVSSMTDGRLIASAIRAGAVGFVPKHSRRDVFRAAFSTICTGGVFVPEGVVLDTAPGQQQTDREDALQRLSLLTPQQARILRMICAGKLNKQIAFDLSIAETTVKAHVTAIMRKLGVQSRTQAVLIAQEASYSSVLNESRQGAAEA